MNGGKSTGPWTAAGLARSKNSTWVHGRYSAGAIAERKEARRVVAAIEELIALTSAKATPCSQDFRRRRDVRETSVLSR
jgi:hypothetical protein